MNIKGLDYNTQREKLLLPEYGREIQKMVDHAVGLPTKELRQECAKTIVQLMETKVPQLSDSSDFERTLWDHLYLMSHKQLDIDWPFDVTDAEKILSKPQPMKLPKENIRMRHYGKLVEQLFEKLKQMPPGDERDALTHYTANQMKRDLSAWGHGSLEDERIANDLARFTDGVIQLDLGSFRFEKLNPATEESKKSKKKR